MESYYSCSLFSKNIDNLLNFSTLQEQLFLKKFDGTNASYEKLFIEYKCSFKENNTSDWKKPCVLIPIRDNNKLLKYTLDNFITYNVFNHINLIVIDDRSSENVLDVVKNYPASYLRVDNERGFNFSMLNNIAAKIAYDKGSTEIILWNSDLFVPDENQVPQLIKLHKDNNSTISGTKLLYPKFAWDDNFGPSHSMQTIFPNKCDTYRGTIQFGGSFYVFDKNSNTYMPHHFCRFKEPSYFLASENKMMPFLTGAFQIINLEWFIKSGGLNPSMALLYQDVDVCMRAYAENKKVFYFGKSNYLYHDESVSTSKMKRSEQNVSDHVLYCKTWNLQRYIKYILKNED